MKIAVIGATGLVGQTIIRVLDERNFPVKELIPAASEKSIGQKIPFRGKQCSVVSIEAALKQKPQLVFFSAGGDISKEWAEQFAEKGAYVVDNSSAWRMDPGKKLVVPEVNGDCLVPSDRVIANPNCSTIQMVAVLKPLDIKYGLKRVVVSTYQSVTGSGHKGIAQLKWERENVNVVGTSAAAYPYPIDLNVIPHIDVFLDNGYSKEEMKMIQESQKILNLPNLNVTATAVRVPVMGGHSESVNVEMEKDFELDDVRKLLSNTKGIILLDNPKEQLYPIPLTAFGKDDIFVGRIRKDLYQKNALNCWIVADNLRKGAATNAVQIGEYILSKGWLN